MTNPARPWEASNSNSSFFSTGVASGPAGDQSSAPAPLPAAPLPAPPRGVRPGQPPPLPPRHHLPLRAPLSHRFGGSYGLGYGGYGGGYGGGYSLGGYTSPYGGYLGAFQRHQDYDNRYVALAEESAAPAFESIESFVRGFTSVTMMLESTFQALQMSFRAILGVVENMSRMRKAILDFVSALTLFKALHYFYRRILALLGLVNSAEVTWRALEQEVTGAGVTGARATGARTTPTWPMLAFLGAIVAGPALVYKYLLPQQLPDEEVVELVACYDFESEQPGELSFAKGDRLVCKRSELKKSWIMAEKGNSRGYVPCNRLRMVLKAAPVAKNT